MARLLLLVALAVLGLGLAGCGGRGEDEKRVVPLGAEKLSFDRSGWGTDFSRRTVVLEEIQTGGPPRDGIPPIDAPRPVDRAAGEGYLSEREPVLVVEVGGAARAYPLRILVWHEIVNDRLGGRPITVTYCPLCNSSLVFERRIGGRELSFGTTGNLRRSNPIMWDRQTESWWQQLTADSIVGELAGRRLRALPAQTLSWGQFKRRHPRGDVLSRDTGVERDYESNPYLGYDESASSPHLFRGRVDDRLPPKERVVALLEAEPAVVVPFSRLERERVVQLTAGSKPAVVFHERGVASPIDSDALSRAKDVGTAGAFDRRLRGRTLSFARRGEVVVDRETGSSWDVTGRAVAGRLRGERLRPLRHDLPFWFSLAAFVPEAQIAARPSAPE